MAEAVRAPPVNVKARRCRGARVKGSGALLACAVAQRRRAIAPAPFALGLLCGLRLEIRGPKPQLLDHFRHSRDHQQLAAALGFPGEISGIGHREYLQPQNTLASAEVHDRPDGLNIPSSCHPPAGKKIFSPVLTKSENI